LPTQPRLRPVEVVEVPESTEAVVHDREAYAPHYASPVELSVTPALDDSTERALRSVLGAVRAGTSQAEVYESVWRRAGLTEGVEPDDADPGYAPSPRSTRGATRA
jgi:hypothetical protein